MPTLDVAINALRAKHGAAQFDAAVKKIKRGSKDVDRSVKKTDKAVKGLGTQVQSLALGFIGAGAAYKGLRFSASSVKAFADFELNLANISTMLDDQSMRFLPGYAAQLDKLAKKYGQTTAVLSKGLYDILSASVDASEALKLLEVSSRAAIGGMTDTGTAADALTTILNSYNLSADEAAKISDILFTIVKRGKITFGELAGSIGKVAALAASSGLSIEEVGAALATMTRSGVQADLAMTSLKAILTAFLSPTDDSVKVAKEFGLELNTATLRSIGLTGAVRVLTKATAEQRSAIFPNVRAITGLATIVQNTAGHMRDLKLMTDASGASLEAFGKIANTTAQQLAKNRELWASIKRDIGEGITPEVSNWLSGMNTLVNEWQRGAVSIKRNAEILAQAKKLGFGWFISMEEFELTRRLMDVDKTLESFNETMVAAKIKANELNTAMQAEPIDLTHWSVLEQQAEDAANAIEVATDAQRKAGLAVMDAFKLLEIERGLIGKTNDERERAIALKEFEKNANNALTDNSERLIADYKAELIAQQELRKQAEETQRFYGEIEKGTAGVLKSPLTALLDETRDIGDVLKDELKRLGTDIVNMMYEDLITNPLMDVFKQTLKGMFSGGGEGGTGGFWASLFGSATAETAAKGLLLNGTSVKQCGKGDILSGPTLFPMSNGGTALGGEAGEEGLFPLGRDKQGRLGVIAADGGGSEPQAIKIINVMDQAEVQEYINSADGERQIINIMSRNRNILAE